MEIAEQSGAKDVVSVLQGWGDKRKEVMVTKIVVDGAGYKSVNGEYVTTSAEEIPSGFHMVCRQHKWDSKEMWQKLNGDKAWFKAPNEAYIYWNRTDGQWWIDEPSGNGLYVAKSPSWAPPQSGWKALGPFDPLPSFVAIFRDET